MKYLVDTNILVYLMNAKSKLLELKFSLYSTKDFAVSIITVAELLYGAKKSVHVERNLNAVFKILSTFEIVDFTSKDTVEYATIRAELEASGKIIGPNDLLIAAQAKRLNCTVVTANVKEFDRVKNLKVENWAHL